MPWMNTDDVSTFLALLNILFDKRTSDSEKESVAFSIELMIHSLEVASIGLLPAHSSHWILRAIWERLPHETNENVGHCLLRMANCLLEGTWYQERGSNNNYHKYHKEIFRQGMLSVLSLLERGCSSEMIRIAIEIVTKCKVQDKYIPLVIKCCVRAIELHMSTEKLAPSDLTTINVYLANFFGQDRYPWGRAGIAVIIGSSCMMGYLFERFARPKTFGNIILPYLLNRSNEQDRVSLVIRYFHQLQTAFRTRPREDGSYNFLIHKEFAGIIAATPSLLKLVYKWYGTAPKCDYSNGTENCLVPLSIIDSSLENEVALDNVLSMGFLNCAAHFASSSRHQFFMRNPYAEVFRRLLAVRPQWRHHFKRIVDPSKFDANSTNPVVLLARSIPDRVTRTTEYNLLDDL